MSGCQGVKEDFSGDLRDLDIFFWDTLRRLQRDFKPSSHLEFRVLSEGFRKLHRLPRNLQKVLQMSFCRVSMHLSEFPEVLGSFRGLRKVSGSTRRIFHNGLKVFQRVPRDQGSIKEVD